MTSQDFRPNPLVVRLNPRYRVKTVDIYLDPATPTDRIDLTIYGSDFMAAGTVVRIFAGKQPLRRLVRLWRALLHR